MGELKTLSLRQIATINYGKSPTNVLSIDGKYPVVGTGGTERFGSKFLHEGKSIILGRKGTIDHVHFVKGKFWVIDTAYYLSGFVEANPEWLFYFLQTIDFRKMNEATGVPSLSRNVLYNIEIQKPPLKEQQKVVDILSKIDQAIEETEKLVAKYSRIKTGMMQDLLTKGIDENGNIRSEKTHEFKDSPLGRIPKEWEITNLQEIGSRTSQHIKTGPFGSSLKIEHWKTSGVPVVTIGSLGENEFQKSALLYILEEKANELSSYRLYFGDVLFSRVADVGRSLVIGKNEQGWVMSSNFMRIRLDLKKFDPLFLHLLFKFSHEFDKQAKSNVNASGRSVTNSSILNSFLFPFTDILEQQKIVSISKSNDQCIKGLKSQLSKLQKLKTGLMHDLLTGKVRVTELLKKEK